MLNYFFSFGIAEIVSHLSVAGITWIMIWSYRKLHKLRLRQPANDAYMALQGACEPETLNPNSPNNPDAMKALARNLVNMLRPRLKRAGLYPPEPADRTDESLQLWFHYLASVRPGL